MLNKIYQINNDITYEDTNDHGITRVIDVCEKSDGRFAIRSYEKQMNSDGDFNAMPIYIDEIKEIMEMIKYEK